MARETGMLLSNAIQRFVSERGRLDYQYSPDHGHKRWFVYGDTESGERLPILVDRTGERKQLRNANAVVNYHQEFCPMAGGVFIPFDPPEDSQPSLSATKNYDAEDFSGS